MADSRFSAIRSGLLALRGVAIIGICALLALALDTPARAQAIRIMYFERLGDLHIPEPVAPGSQSQKPQPAGTSLAFQAFGRQFDLVLERNDRLTRKLSAETKRRIADVALYRGQVVGLPGSWVRLTRRGRRLSGAVWDGTDLYAIEQYDRVASLLASPDVSAAGTTIVYRRSDTIGSVSDQIVDPLSLAGAKPAQISAELSALATVISPGKQLDIGLVADVEFAAREGANTEEAMLSIANIADGIFGEQVGVHLNVAALEIFDTEPDPFTSSDSQVLLTELSDYKDSTAAQRALGLVHLMTGRDLIEPPGMPAGQNLLGIANFGTLCDPRLAVSLSQASDNVTQALVAAHEIGHNFGAPHDGEPGSACASTPATFLMAALYNGSDQFSACSLQQMQPELAAAACLTDVPPNDLSLLPARVPVQAPGQPTFFGSVAIDNTGPTDAFGVAVSFDAADIELTAVYGLDSCTLNASGRSSCTIYRLPGGQSQLVGFTGMGTQPQPGQGTIDVSLTSWNDPNPANDAYHFVVDVVPPVSFGAGAVTATPDAVHPGETSEITWNFVNAGPGQATDVVLNVSSLSPYYELVAVYAPPGSCDQDPAVAGHWTCSIASMPPNGTKYVFVQVRAASSGLPPGPFTDGMLNFAVSSAEPQLNPASWLYMPLEIASNIADLALDMSAPASAVEGSPVEVTLVGRNDGPDAAKSVALTFDDASALSFTDVASGTATCTIETEHEIDCSLASLAAGATFTVTIDGTARAPGSGPYPLHASIGGEVLDPFADNGKAFTALQVSSAPAAPPPTTGSSGGGGGAVDPLGLLALLAMIAARRRRSCSLPEKSTEC